MARGIRKTKAPISAPQEAVAATPAPVLPAPPSPAVLKLQDQVVELVAHRNAARQRLSEAHTTYLTVQASFQAAEAHVKATEQDAQYLLGLIAQLENRQPAPAQTFGPALVPQMPNSLANISSEPSAPAVGSGTQSGSVAMSPLMTRREVTSMM